MRLLLLNDLRLCRQKWFKRYKWLQLCSALHTLHNTILDSQGYQLLLLLKYLKPTHTHIYVLFGRYNSFYIRFLHTFLAEHLAPEQDDWIVFIVIEKFDHDTDLETFLENIVQSLDLVRTSHELRSEVQ